MIADRRARSMRSIHSIRRKHKKQTKKQRKNKRTTRRFFRKIRGGEEVVVAGPMGVMSQKEYQQAMENLDQQGLE